MMSFRKTNVMVDYKCLNGSSHKFLVQRVLTVALIDRLYWSVNHQFIHKFILAHDVFNVLVCKLECLWCA